MVYLLVVVGLVAWIVYKTKARFQLGMWSFTYPIDEILDMILSHHLDSGISDLNCEDGYYLSVTFKNGANAVFWNRTQEDAWVARGIIGKYRWDKGRPTTETMVKLKKAIKKYYKEKYL